MTMLKMHGRAGPNWPLNSAEEVPLTSDWEFGAAILSLNPN
jgi:hypothetical protein